MAWKGSGATKWGKMADIPAYFPYKIVSVPGDRAVEEWQRLSQDAGTTPIILGSDEDLARVLDAFDPANDWAGEQTPEEILSRAAELSHPESLTALREGELQDLLRSLDATKDGGLIAEIEEDSDITPELLGDWPEEVQALTGPISIYDYQTGQPHGTIHIAILPTAEASQAPALLQFGGWNANPPPEHHVAALRSWAERYGAVPVVISGDVIELRVSRSPATRDEALALAIEHFRYCEDVVTQGVGTVSALAAALMGGDHWYFWWD